MALIYEIESGTIVSENSDVTTIRNYDQLPEHRIVLQPAQTREESMKAGPCDEYMSILRELLKDL
jgi:hypothetical protein